MDAVGDNGNDCPMPGPLRWVVWGAVVVVGSIASFAIWQRALDPGHETLANTPQAVEASAEQSVPASIPFNLPGSRSQHGQSRHGKAGRGVHLPGLGLTAG